MDTPYSSWSLCLLGLMYATVLIYHIPTWDLLGFLAAMWHCWFTICLWSSFVPRLLGPAGSPLSCSPGQSLVLYLLALVSASEECSVLWGISRCWFWPGSTVSQVCFEFLMLQLDDLAPSPRTVSFIKSSVYHPRQQWKTNNPRPRTIFHLKHPPSLTLNYLPFFFFFGQLLHRPYGGFF